MNIKTLTDEELVKTLETETPYKARNFQRPILEQLLKQWIDNTNSWEQFPVSRKEMFLTYKELTGKLPEVATPSAILFKFLKNTERQRGLLH